MVDGLAVKDDNYTALVSVKSFVFTNSIPNIPRNGNILKFLSVWYNAAAAAYQSNIIQVNIPVGNVTSTSLLNYLNGFNNGTGNGLICNNFSGGFYYGMGSPASGSINGGTFTYRAAFYRSQNDPTRVNMYPPYLGGLNATISPNHQYTGFDRKTHV